MNTSKSTPLTEFKLTNSNFKESEITVENIKDVENGVIVNNLLSESECDLISTTIFKQLDEKNEFIKHGLRIHKNSNEFANVLFERVSKHCTQELKRKNPTNSEELLNWKLDSISDKFRFIRYNTGEEFPNHTDGETKYNENKSISFFSILIFTNDCNKDFVGGEFRFFKKDKQLNLIEISRVTPKRGLCLIFPHTIIHDSLVIKSGQKQTIRSDIVYTKTN